MRSSFVATTLQVGSGIAVWSIHFALIYGLTAISCERGRDELVPTVIASATVVAASLVAAIIAYQWRRREKFEAWLAASLAGFALLAIVFEGLTVLIVPPCQ